MSKIKHNFKEGDKIGNSIFIKRISSKHGCPMALLLCECGKEFETRIQSLVSGKTKSCGCLQRKVASEVKNIYVNGDKIGNCVYLSDAPYKPHNPRRANFLCKCGNEFVTAIQSVENGTTVSCGCLKLSLLSEKGANKEKALPILSVNDINRFWGKVSFTMSIEKCWDWQGTGQRYGSFNIKGEGYKSNRIAYLIANKSDPLELEVMHSCHNTKCCNPTHLSLGTHFENMQDMVKSGRSKTCGVKSKIISSY